MTFLEAMSARRGREHPLSEGTKVDPNARNWHEMARPISTVTCAINAKSAISWFHGSETRVLRAALQEWNERHTGWTKHI